MNYKYSIQFIFCNSPCKDAMILLNICIEDFFGSLKSKQLYFVQAPNTIQIR